MSGGEASKELNGLLRQLRGTHAGEACAGCETALDPAEPLLGRFLHSFLLWESTSAKAAAAIKRIEHAVGDYNELRVCLTDELVSILGERYPRAGERAAGLRRALNAIYIREHLVSLEHLCGKAKRESREYLDTLSGVPPFVAARVSLLSLGGHAAPVDSRILRRLVESRVFDASVDCAGAAAWIERKVRAGELVETYTLLQYGADQLPLGEAEGAGVSPRGKAVKGRAVKGSSASKGAGAAARKPARRA